MQEDRRLARSRMAVQKGGIQAAVNYLSANDTPQLLIVEAADTGDALFDRIEALAEVCDPNSSVVLIGPENDIALYRQLKEMGLAEYFSGDLTTDQLVASIEAVYGGETAETQGRLIGFMGARGGVGSSIVAANTAESLGIEYKDDVLLIDCDLSFGTAALTCNVEPKQNLADALAQPGRLDETLVERVRVKVDDFFSLIPAPAILAGDYEIDAEAFEQMLTIARGMASFVVLDLPHHWSPWVQDVLLDADEVVVVSTPDLAGMRDTKNISDAIKGGPGDGIKLALNKVGMTRKTEISSKDFENQIDIIPSVNIPFDGLVFGNAMNNGELLSKVSKGGKVMAEISKLARLASGAEPISKAEAKARSKKMKSQKRSGFSALKFAK